MNRNKYIFNYAMSTIEYCVMSGEVDSHSGMQTQCGTVCVYSNSNNAVCTLCLCVCRETHVQTVPSLQELHLLLPSPEAY